MTKKLSEFEKHTTKTIHKDGRCTIDCNKGLWSVDAQNELQAISEAVPYYLQYWSDGEYSDNQDDQLLGLFYQLRHSQKPLEPELQKILIDNMDDLYA